MCLIALEWRQGFLRVASNRDEVLDRPAQPAHVWEEEVGWQRRLAKDRRKGLLGGGGELTDIRVR